MPKNRLRDIAESETLPRLWHNVIRAFRAEGFGAGSYHPLHGQDRVPAIRPVTFGYPRHILNAYFETDFYRLDAVPRAIIPTGRVMTWSEAWASLDLTADEAHFWDNLKKAGSVHGLAIPCYGPQQRNGYITLSKMDPGRDFPPGERRWLQCLAQAGHMRLSELLFDTGERTRLSPREKEILHWVALGKSNPVIAQLVECSANTVDTHLRRIFSKLAVTDRTSASVKAIGLGLIR